MNIKNHREKEKLFTFLLIIIYFAFISLGLPDAILGAAWPVMQLDINAPFESVGLLSMIIAGGTIISSLFSGVVLNRFGTGKVTAVSVLLTAIALLGFYFSPSLIWLTLCAVPLGLGAGAVDAGLNAYVAANYKAHHMSWLHCFWGIGATIGPIIMAQTLSASGSWREVYFTIAIIQFLLVFVLFLSLPLWKKRGHTSSEMPETIQTEKRKTEKPLHIKGVKLSLLTFLFYCGAEAAIGLLGSSYLVNAKDLGAATAAQWISLYYAGITVGRFITGFITFRVSNKMLIRYGQLTALIGTILLILPFPPVFSLIGFIIIGLGLAPIYPCMLHETPERFGRTHSQTIMGFQMAIAYTGTTFIPPILGVLVSQASMMFLPFSVVLFVLIMLVSTERLNATLKSKKLLSK